METIVADTGDPNWTCDKWTRTLSRSLPLPRLQLAISNRLMEGMNRLQTRMGKTKALLGQQNDHRNRLGDEMCNRISTPIIPPTCRMPIGQNKKATSRLKSPVEGSGCINNWRRYTKPKYLACPNAMKLSAKTSEHACNAS